MWAPNGFAQAIVSVSVIQNVGPKIKCGPKIISCDHDHHVYLVDHILLELVGEKHPVCRGTNKTWQTESDRRTTRMQLYIYRLLYYLQMKKSAHLTMTQYLCHDIWCYKAAWDLVHPSRCHSFCQWVSQVMFIHIGSDTPIVANLVSILW